MFTYFGTGMVSKILSYFDEMESAFLLEYAIYTKGLHFLLSGRLFSPFWLENFEKSWQHWSVCESKLLTRGGSFKEIKLSRLSLAD
jgi:hypothetical protein